MSKADPHFVLDPLYKQSAKQGPETKTDADKPKQEKTFFEKLPQPRKRGGGKGWYP